MTLTDELLEAICPDDAEAIFVASAIKKLSLQFKKQGAIFEVNTLIDGILQKIGTEKSLIIPAYTDTLKNGASFNSNKSKPTIGALPARAFKRKDYYRSKDPLHSAFIWGPMQHLNYNGQHTFGENSLFYNMHKNNVLQVFIDVSLQNSFTFIHYVEALMKVNYRKDYNFNFTVDGQAKSLIFNTRKPGYVTHLDDLQAEMIEKGVLQKQMFYGIPIYSMYSQAAFDFLKQSIEKHGGKTWRKFSFKEYFRRHAKRILKGQAI